MPFSDDFSNRTLFITGANGGIGRALAGRAIRSGANITLCDLDVTGLEEFAATFGAEASDRIQFLELDVTQSQAVDKAMDDSVAHFGAIDVLVANAGIAPPGPIRTTTDEAWRAVYAVNVEGVFYCCRKAAQIMKPGSSMVLLGSVAGHRGTPERAHYASSKAAVIGLGRTLAGELGPDICVNCVSPGTVATPMSEQFIERYGEKVYENAALKRVSAPEEIADAILYLASSSANGITGISLQVNNGTFIGG